MRGRHYGRVAGRNVRAEVGVEQAAVDVKEARGIRPQRLVESNRIFVAERAERLASEAERQVVVVGAVIIDLLARNVRRDGAEVHVTPKEWDLLVELAKHPGRVLTHETLLRSVWGPAHVGQTEYLRVAIRGLRQKLEEQPSQPRLIINEPGVGYRLLA